ncbi:MAG: hypothetical protein Q9214_003403 [Letrouitia sp. 1 TL-2023]
MSLYHEAAQFLRPTSAQTGSLQSRIFSSTSLKNAPKQVFALVIEVSKWSEVLSEVVENSRLLQHERKLSPSLAILLVHDLLLSHSGIAAPLHHPLREAVTRHRARLSAELTRARLRRGFQSCDALRAHLGGESLNKGKFQPTNPLALSSPQHWPHPRWVRVNTLLTSLDEQLQSTFADYQRIDTLRDLLRKRTNAEEKVLYIDRHIPNLIALAPQADLVDTVAYRNGLIILQDKASCFPACLLNPSLEEGPCLDACAAPGNKTTHLAAIIQNSNTSGKRGKIWACERDFSRSETLRRMVAIAGADQLVAIKAGQDFLSLDPSKPPWNQVAFLLLDPSCSGSGIVGRDNIEVITLPRDESGTPAPSKKRKRKRDATNVPATSIGEQHSPSPQRESKVATRLTALAAFQSKLLKHAFAFPRASKIAYSTCSIHAEENELVVAEVLESIAAQQGQWRLLRRHEQVAEMRDWHIRGNPDYFFQAMTGKPLDLKENADACLRCEKGTEDGTQGFFVAAFVKSTDANGTINARDETKGALISLKHIGGDEETDDEEWEGLSETY